MPEQLARGLRERKGMPPRPILESLPQIHIKALTVPERYGQTITQDLSLKLPRIANAKVSCESVTFYHKALHRKETGLVQDFRLKAIRVGFGLRYAFICSCNEPVLRLYYHGSRLACRYCLFGIYASQRLNKRTRPILQAVRITDFLDNHPRLRKAKAQLMQKLGAKVMKAQGKCGTRANQSEHKQSSKHAR